MIPRIKKITPVGDLKLHIVFDDGYTVIYDVKEDINNIPYYSLLESEDGLFEQVHLDPSRSRIYWTDEIDLPSDILYEYGEPTNELMVEATKDDWDGKDNVQALCNEIIRELVKLRKEKGLTQHQLAAISGVKQPAIARLEKGDCVPKTDTITKLLSAMGKRLAFVDI